MVLSGLAGGAANAQLFPSFPADSSWLTVSRGGVAITDIVDGPRPSLDIVGSLANPAAQYYADSNHLYFRLRLDGNPAPGGVLEGGSKWGVQLDVDGDSRYDYALLASSGFTNLWANPISNGLTLDSPEILLRQYFSSTHTRVVSPTGSGDYLVDLALARSDLGSFESLRLVFGTTSVSLDYFPEHLSPSSVDIGVHPNSIGRDTTMWSSYASDPISFATPTSPIPEPETYAMLLAGLALLGFHARRRNTNLQVQAAA